MANVLSRHHDVCVITPAPGYPSPKLYDHIRVDELDKKFAGRVIRCRAFIPHRPSLVMRAIREVGLALKLTFRGILLHADVILVSTPSMFLAPFAWGIARLKRVKFIFDLRDVTWRYVRETARPSKLKAIMSIFLENLMIFFLRRTDLIICATSGIAEIIENDYGLSRKKVITIMNGVSEDMFILGGRPNLAFMMERPIVSYIGLFGYNHGIGILLDVAKQIPDVRFLLIGDGPERDNILERLSREGISNLNVIGYVTSAEELSSYYQKSTILFSHLRNKLIMKSTVIPAKVFEYMAFGKPIIYAGEGIAVDFLENIGCALTVPPDDPAAIVAAVSDLLENPGRMKEMGQKGRAFIEKSYRREILMEQLLEHFVLHFRR